MKWYEVESGKGGDCLYTDVAQIKLGCLVRTYGWETTNFETAMGVGLVFVPGAELEDFGLEPLTSREK